MSNTQTYTTRIFLNSEQAKKRLDELSAKIEKIRKDKDEAATKGDWKTFNDLKKQLDRVNSEMRDMNTSSQKVSRILDNLSVVSVKEISQTISAINKELRSGAVERGSSEWNFLNEQLKRCNQELKNIREESKVYEDGESGIFKFFSKWNQAGIFFSNLFGFGEGLSGVADKMTSLIQESITLADSAEGIEMAFSRLNRPDLLDGLRAATHGTVNDLELMKQAVKFKDFNLPVEQLGKYLAFAQQKAKDTGESIDYLVDSIVNGLGRQSKMILDNLGISANEIDQEVAKTGDFVNAVTAIVERNMDAMGTYTETASDRSAQAAARLQNAQVELGKQLQPIKESAAGLFSTIQLGTIKAISFTIKHKSVIIAVANALTIYAAAYATLYAWQKKNAVITALTTTYETALTAARKVGITVMGAYRVAVALMTGNVQAATVAIRAMNIAMKSNPYMAIISLLVAVGTAVYGLVSAFTKSNSSVRKNTEALKQQQQQLRNIRDIEEQANRSTSERVAKVNMLRKTVEDSNETYGKRKQALLELRRIVPEYHGHLSKEKGLINSNTEAIDRYLKKLKNVALAQAAMGKMTSLTEQLMNIDIQLKKLEEAKKKRDMVIVKKYADTRKPDYTPDPYQGTINHLKKQKKDIENQISDINNYMKKNGVDLTKTIDDNMTTTKDGGYNTIVGDKTDKDNERLRKEEQKAKAESDAAIAIKNQEYASGKISYRAYLEDLYELQRAGLEKRMNVYKEGSAEYESLNKQIQDLDLKQVQQTNQMKLEDLQRLKIKQQASLELAAAQGIITEEEKQDSLRTLDEQFLKDKVELYKEGSKERIEAEWELEQTENRNKIEREKAYYQKIEQLKNQFAGKSNEEQMKIALDGLDLLHKKMLISEKQYQEAKLAIQAQYSGYETRSDRTQKTAKNMLSIATDKANEQLDNSGSKGLNIPIVGDIMRYKTTMEKLKELYGDDEANHEAYLAAKQQATSDFCEGLSREMQVAYDSVNSVMSAASNYFSAQQEYEVNIVKAKYEKQIEAAGNNQAKVKKLQEKQQKEEAAIKTKYAKKAAAIQMAQAVAQTAISAINAYSSAAAIPVTGVWLAPIAAAMAIAAGMLQIATIKKQQKIQEQGYYDGGFTGGRRYREEAGVVHEGEFVANHKAVNNPAIVPLLNFIDRAQRNNTIGSLTMGDVSRALSNGSGANVVAPIVNVQTDNEELNKTLSNVNDSIAMLNMQLVEGINATVAIDGPKGLHRQYTNYKKMIERV